MTSLPEALDIAQCIRRIVQSDMTEREKAEAAYTYNLDLSEEQLLAVWNVLHREAWIRRRFKELLLEHIQSRNSSRIP